MRSSPETRLRNLFISTTVAYSAAAASPKATPLRCWPSDSAPTLMTSTSPSVEPTKQTACRRVSRSLNSTGHASITITGAK